MTCSICQCSKDTLHWSLICGHKFHVGCLQNVSHCPTCHTLLKRNDINLLSNCFELLNFLENGIPNHDYYPIITLNCNHSFECCSLENIEGIENDKCIRCQKPLTTKDKILFANFFMLTHYVISKIPRFSVFPQ